MITLQRRAEHIADIAAETGSPSWRRTYHQALRHLREVEQTVRSHALNNGFEHAEWCRNQGKTAGDALAELGQPVPLLPTWSDVAEAAARINRGISPAAR